MRERLCVCVCTRERTVCVCERERTVRVSEIDRERGRTNVCQAVGGGERVI